MSAEDFSLDHALIRRRFSAAAQSVSKHDFVAREISSRMAERLDYIRLAPGLILDLGSGHGPDQAMLAERYPDARRLALDNALPLLQLARPQRSFLQRVLRRDEGPALICGDAAQLPLARDSVHLVWSNLLLNWLSDPADALREAHRVLAVDGLLMFSTLGPDTLRELRDALPGPLGARVHRFIDMHDIGDCLVKAGFSDPVMDMQTLTLTYPDARSLFAELRASASSSASRTRPRGLTGRRAWADACARLDALRQAGRIPATLEVVFGHAWKPEPKTIDDGRAIIRFRSRES
ncbi:methyltransferase domain-containing protein [Uliginosibacterium paludis]|uniref:Malonyl-[acyl-carrier protein] O-methyltransferase n=1 Tax=Uliginosibacterium paludis TaxID=1615952 RepID=A0ABV2CKP2_9RHOO